MLINVKMTILNGILTFMIMINFMVICVELKTINILRLRYDTDIQKLHLLYSD